MEINTQKKQEIKRLISKDSLEKALQTFLEETSGEAMVGLHNEAVALTGVFNKYQKDNRLGVENYDDLVRTKTKISLALLDLVDKVPALNGSENKNTKKAGIRESKLKRNVGRLLVAGKIVSVGFLLILWDSGGFTVDQFVGTLTLLIPLFTVYTVITLRDSTKFRYVDISPESTELLVTHRFKWSAYFWLIGYALAIIFVLYLKPSGAIDYKQMSVLLTIVEVGMGVYVGEIVFALFKKMDRGQ